jgi:hypothetical protein
MNTQFQLLANPRRLVPVEDKASSRKGGEGDADKPTKTRRRAR